MSTKHCQECRIEVALYQCPRCSFRSCSLPCCRAHKDRGCSGKRDRTAYTRNMTDEILRSDYHFLEDILGTVDSSKRLLQQVGAEQSFHDSKKSKSKVTTADHTSDTGSDSPPHEPPHTLLRLERSEPGGSLPAGNNPHSPGIHPKWKQLQKQAFSKGITVLYMPIGMERRKSNRSYGKSNKIQWTVEWIIYSNAVGQPKSITHHSISEDTHLWTALAAFESHVTPSSWRILLKRIPCPSHQPLYVELCDDPTLASALKDTTVLEYPTLYVVPVEQLSKFPRVIAEVPNAEVGQGNDTTTST